ncbi:MAG: hypothetical protein J6T11_06475 [Bacteroidaceae bacterium]|nr:hypothetical protein [Bacteroidaceae bacterium]
MNFIKERFANFATYDLTINKAFYRNMALVTIAGAVCIALLGFIGRYTLYSSVVNNTMSGPAYSYVPDAYSFEGYNWIYFTAMGELGFLFIMMQIFAGCWAHNLRNKQGRINELTLPATNLEKFTWHALLILAGGFILCILSLLLADGFNALLTLISYGAENGIKSLTASVGEMCSFQNIAETVFFRGIGHSSDRALPQEAVPYFSALTAVTFCSAFFQVTIYFLGNAFKYKYNIVLTYVALQVIGTILSFFFFMCGAMGAASVNLMDFYFSEEDAVNTLTAIYWGLAFLSLVGAAFFIWWSYNRYTKAQITSSFNK